MTRALACVALALLSTAARAADLTDIGTAFEPSKRYDIRFRFSYQHREKTGQLKRELEGLDPQQTTVRLLKDLTFTERRDVVSMRLEAGIFTDLALHAELPIVVAQQTTYRFDQSAGDRCVFPPSVNPNCVNAQNSSTVSDGIATASAFPFPGAARGSHGASALDTFNLGLTWAPLTQRKDPSKPTWTIGFEAQLSVGNIKRFDRALPNANRAVSEGVHRLLFQTAVSRRVRYLDPFVSFWVLVPIARGDSLFTSYGAANTIQSPPVQLGATLGLEGIVYERPGKDYRVTVLGRGRIAARFAGRGYSEAWELFATSPALACDPAFNLACDATLTKNPYQGTPFTGLTAIDGYTTAGFDLAATAQITRWFRARVGFDYSHDQSHFITNDEVGVPNPTNNRISTAGDYNPAWRQVIDQPGRRYKVDNVNVYDIHLSAQVLF